CHRYAWGFVLVDSCVLTVLARPPMSPFFPYTTLFRSYEPVFNYMEELRKQGYKIYGLSNTGMQFANFVKNSEMGNYFDGYVFSADRKSTRLNSSHVSISYAVFCLEQKIQYFGDWCR